MSDEERDRQPKLSAAAAAGKAAREQRLAAAMRDNLRKRKAQQRGRVAADPAPARDGAEGGDPGGSVAGSGQAGVAPAPHRAPGRDGEDGP